MRSALARPKTPCADSVHAPPVAWQLFAREAYSNDFYDEQARSFLRFRLAVRPDREQMTS